MLLHMLGDKPRQGTPMFMAPEMILGKAVVVVAPYLMIMQGSSGLLLSVFRATRLWPISGVWAFACTNLSAAQTGKRQNQSPTQFAFPLGHRPLPVCKQLFKSWPDSLSLFAAISVAHVAVSQLPGNLRFSS